jgi:hypothetical protein
VDSFAEKKSYYINQDTRNTIALLTPLLLFGGSFDIHIVATPGTGVKYYIYIGFIGAKTTFRHRQSIDRIATRRNCRTVTHRNRTLKAPTHANMGQGASHDSPHLTLGMWT